MTKRGMWLVLLVLGVHFFGVCEGAEKERLLHVTVVFRHGARTHLSKEADPFDGEGGAQLLVPQGRDRPESLGKYVRDSYIVTSESSKKIYEVKSTYETVKDLRVISSNLDRTLASAHAFVAGLYENQAGIPIQVTAVEGDDFMLRSYTKCPNYSTRLDTFFASEEYKAKDAEDSDFRKKYADGFEEDSALKEWPNVYDKYLLARQYGIDNVVEIEQPNGIDVTAISASDVEKMYEIMYWLESRKFGPELTGNELSARLLSQILSHMDAMSAEKHDAHDVHKIVAYSAHYPTIMALVARLTGKPMTKIPEFGEGIVIEHTSFGARLAVLTYTDSSWTSEYVGFGTTSCSDANDACEIADIKSMLGSSPLASDDSTACELCGNTEATVCVVKGQGAVGGETPGPEATSAPQATPSPQVVYETVPLSGAVRFGYVILGVVVSVAVILIYLAFKWWWKRRKNGEKVIMPCTSSKDDGIVQDIEA